ncbi:hypothetical protein Tco_1147495, partial [Tanacetum coccineum]
DLTGNEDPTDEDGDTRMGDSTGVSVSLGGEISSGRKKSQEHTGSYYPKRYWELLPKEILGATTQRDTGSYYPKRYWELLPKEIDTSGATTSKKILRVNITQERETESYYPKRLLDSYRNGR